MRRSASPTGTYFAGDIFSSRKACKNDRPVQVFRVKPGADQDRQARSYKGKAQHGYYWTLYKEDEFSPSGNYYAKVKPDESMQGRPVGDNIASDF